MGNAFILILVATFGVVWGTFAHRWAWAAYRRLFLGPNSQLKSAWYWGIVTLTIGLLLSFAMLGIALPALLTNFFDRSQEVSVSLIAGTIVIVLALSWLVSLNRYRVSVEDFFLPS